MEWCFQFQFATIDSIQIILSLFCLPLPTILQNILELDTGSISFTLPCPCAVLPQDVPTLATRKFLKNQFTHTKLPISGNAILVKVAMAVVAFWQSTRAAKVQFCAVVMHGHVAIRALVLFFNAMRAIKEDQQNTIQDTILLTLSCLSRAKNRGQIEAFTSSFGVVRAVRAQVGQGSRSDVTVWWFSIPFRLRQQSRNTIG